MFDDFPGFSYLHFSFGDSRATFDAEKNLQKATSVTSEWDFPEGLLQAVYSRQMIISGWWFGWNINSIFPIHIGFYV